MKQFIWTIATLSALLLASCSNDDENPVKSPIDSATDLYGVVTDNQGNFLPNVVVSDGYSCDATDENGVYQLTRNALSYQVYVSIPEQYEVPISSGLPYFWQQLQGERNRYDFALTPLTGGVETDFNLFCIADPQCESNTNVARFSKETVPDIAAQVAASTLPCYGITLGDIIWNSAKKDVTNDIMSPMKLAMAQTRTGLPIFQSMGNHDNKVISVKKGDYTVEHDVAAQRNFEYALGPINYSFNRGNAHIVVMDDILFPNHDDYSLGFREDQVQWLTQDLSHVAKEKMIILCVHIPLRDSNAQNVQAVLALIKDYAEVHVMSGHTHYAENNIYGEIYEHVHGAACGAWWHSTVNTDGTPNGYAIYTVKGATIDRWSYKATGLDATYQIRLYRGNDTFMTGYKPSYQFYYKADNQIVANVWNADAKWTIDVYENGTKSGSMKPFASSVTKRDAWASGYHCGVQGRNPDSYDRTNNSHLYYYTLTSPTATVEVKATDPFGNTYTQSTFTSGEAADYPVGE
ncbi:MAG: calcineurin-like phosphoesterase family protein [Alistipes sp.]